MLVCNGETPCPTLLAEEGDLVQLAVHNDLYAQSSIHWYVIEIPLLKSRDSTDANFSEGLAKHIKGEYAHASPTDSTLCYGVNKIHNYGILRLTKFHPSGPWNDGTPGISQVSQGKK